MAHAHVTFAINGGLMRYFLVVIILFSTPSLPQAMAQTLTTDQVAIQEAKNEALAAQLYALKLKADLEQLKQQIAAQQESQSSSVSDDSTVTGDATVTDDTILTSGTTTE